MPSLSHFLDGLGRLWLLVQASAQPEEPTSVLDRLDPPRRAMVLMTLLGIIILGLFMIMATRLGARYVRKLINRPIHKLPDPSQRTVRPPPSPAVGGPGDSIESAES